MAREEHRRRIGVVAVTPPIPRWARVLQLEQMARLILIPTRQSKRPGKSNRAIKTPGQTCTLIGRGDGSLHGPARAIGSRGSSLIPSRTTFGCESNLEESKNKPALNCHHCKDWAGSLTPLSILSDNLSDLLIRG
jgi:hypothetical protein